MLADRYRLPSIYQIFPPVSTNQFLVPVGKEVMKSFDHEAESGGCRVVSPLQGGWLCAARWGSVVPLGIFNTRLLLCLVSSYLSSYCAVKECFLNQRLISIKIPPFQLLLWCFYTMGVACFSW